MTALLTDSAMRGFAISFFTSRRVAGLNATFLFFAGITPSSCHTPQGKNGQFRPGEQILEVRSRRKSVSVWATHLFGEKRVW
jgi:hypothetical protein